jgi:hypothetical protein
MFLLNTGTPVLHRSVLNTVSLSIYIETAVRNKCRCSFYCALLTLHVSSLIGGHLQVVLHILIDTRANRMHNPVIKTVSLVEGLPNSVSYKQTKSMV